MTDARTRDLEPLLPGPLPAGETVLWQGGTDWRSLAVHAFHIRKIAVYFGILLAWRAAIAWYDGETFQDWSATMAAMLGVAALCCALLTGIAWLAGRTTVYAITQRRVILRIGIALPMTINIPLRRVMSADLLMHRDGTGDIALILGPDDRIAYLHLWPHARPWRFTRSEPMLRCVADADRAAQILALAAAAEPTWRESKPAGDAAMADGWARPAQAA